MQSLKHPTAAMDRLCLHLVITIVGLKHTILCEHPLWCVL